MPKTKEQTEETVSTKNKTTSKETKVKVKEEIKVVNGIVKAKLLNVRKSPDIESKVLKVINAGDLLQVYLDSKNEWYEVITADGVHGYCMKEFISVNKS